MLARTWLTLRHSTRRAGIWLWRASFTRWGGVLIFLAIVTFFVGLIVIAVRSNSELPEPVTGVTEVLVDDSGIAPQSIKVPVGTTVTWRFVGNERNSRYGDGLYLPMLNIGLVSHAFTEPGTYVYYCTAHHHGERGLVVVVD